MKSVLLLVLSFVSLALFAQEPNWVNPAKRDLNFPDSLYLTGFTTETNEQNKPVNETLLKLGNLAKKDLLESIFIKLSTNTELQVEEKMGTVVERLKISTRVSSKADIAGIKTQTFYDKSSKTLYAFAYALKKDVIAYYKNLIDKKNKAIDAKVREVQKPGTGKQIILKSMMKCFTFFREIDDCEFLLLALGCKFPNERTPELLITVKEKIQSVYETEKITVIVKENELKAKRNMVLKLPVNAKICLQKIGKPDIGMKNVPIRFFKESTGQVLSKTITDNAGQAKCFFDKFTSEKETEIVYAWFDYPKFFDVDSADVPSDIATLISSSSQIKISVSGITVMLISEELDYNKKKENLYIEPKLKDALSSEGFNFTDNEKEADYKIKVKALSREGNKVMDLCFSFVDVTISIMELSSGKEIYKNAINDTKGGGDNFEKAGLAAYKKAGERVNKEVISVLKAK